MSNENIAEIGKATQFSSTNQPLNEKKRVPKYKTWLKRIIRDNQIAFEEKIKKGDYHFWQIAFERAYGKETQPLDITNKNYSNETKQEIESIINDTDRV